MLSVLLLQSLAVIESYKYSRMKILHLIGAYYISKQDKLMRRKKHKQMRRLLRQPRTFWYEKTRTEQWWLNMIGEEASESSWKKNFRMTKDSFMALLEKISPLISPRPNSPNYRLLSAEKKLAVTLYYLKDTGSLWMTANTFGLHQCTVSKTLMEVCDAINSVVGPEYLFLPRNEEEMRKVASEFEIKFGLLQAFGCIDGTHIEIKRPIENAQDFYNYKQFFSFTVQAVCDSAGKFMDIECRWPGSVHDAKVFANSKINENLQTGKIASTELTILPGYDAISNYIIGDPAYPLTAYCIKEYTSCSNNAEVIFNNMLRSARNQVECAFGRLKARWGFLRRKVDLKIETIPKVIYTCFVLHNFCESLSNNQLDEAEVQAQISRHQQEDDQPDPIYSRDDSSGEYVRRVLTEYIAQNLPDSYQ